VGEGVGEIAEWVPIWRMSDMADGIIVAWGSERELSVLHPTHARCAWMGHQGGQGGMGRVLNVRRSFSAANDAHPSGAWMGHPAPGCAPISRSRCEAPGRV
jgi:hypothetical protein